MRGHGVGFVLVTWCLTALVLAGCGQSAARKHLDNPGASRAAGTVWPQSGSEISRNVHKGENFGSAAIVVTDDLGKQIVLSKPPQRVVSLSPNLTEIVFFLGAGDRLVGRTDFCDYPPQAKEKPSIGGIINPSLERVLSLKPDLVLAAHGNDIAFLRRLEREGIAVFGANPKTVDDVFRLVARLAAVLAISDTGKKRAEELRRHVEQLHAEAAALSTRPKALVVLEISPLFVAGSGSFIEDLLRLACMENAAKGEKAWAQWSAERLVSAGPSLLIFTCGHAEYREADEPLLAMLGKRSPWREVPAVRAGNVFSATDDYLTIPGPRLVEGLKELVRIHLAYDARRHERKELGAEHASRH